MCHLMIQFVALREIGCVGIPSIMDESMEIADKDDNIITEDFLSWILLDIDARGAAVATGNARHPSDESQLQDPSTLDHLTFPNERKISSTGSVSSGGGDGGGDSNDSDNHQPGQKRKTSRSRELAKESRKRQRQRMEEMEKKIATLKKENEELQAYLQNVTQRTTEVQKQRLDMERIMSAKLCDMSTMSESGSELEDVLRKFVDLYADYGIYRQKEVCGCAPFPVCVDVELTLPIFAAGGLPHSPAGEVTAPHADHEAGHLDHAARRGPL